MEKIYNHHLNLIPNDFDGNLNLLDYAYKNKYTIEFLSENCFCIFDGNKYLTSFPNGDIKFFSEKLSHWEKFYILEQNVQNLFNFIIEGNKLDCKLKLIKDFRLTLYDNKIHMVLGSTLLTPSYIPSSNLIIQENTLIYKTYKQEYTFKDGKFLIYFSVYGSLEYYECFGLALQSLIEIGGFDGDILIKTDDIELAKKYTSKFKNNFYYDEFYLELGIFNRYILKNDIFKNYSQIVYMDSDIIVNRKISYFLERIQNNSHDFIIYSEFNGEIKNKRVENNDAWFGLNFLKHSKINNCDKHLLNSGFFVISNLEAVKLVFERVLEYRKISARKFGDQPILNVALYNSDIKIDQLYPRDMMVFARSLFEFYKNNDMIFIHFNSGVGNLTKLALMKEALVSSQSSI